MSYDSGSEGQRMDHVGWRTHAPSACVRILREDSSHTFRRGGRCVRHPADYGVGKIDTDTDSDPDADKL
jgi:hypothetical protein